MEIADILYYSQAVGNTERIANMLQEKLNADMYDRIVIATPTWWYTMAPAILTLLSSINLAGKKVILVQTHAGWQGHCLEDMEKLCNGADIISKKDIQFDSNGGDEMITPLKEINTWISSIEEK